MKKFIYFLILFIMFFTGIKVYAVQDYKITEYKKGIYVIELNAKNIEPYYTDELETNFDVYQKTNAKLVVNAGFFDPKNKKTVSYVVINEKTVLDPNNNENLMENTNLIPYLNKILNRSEFRILKDENDQIIYDIAPHNETIKDGLTLVHSIQAGPMLYPDLRLEDEFFILVKNGELKSESASCLHKYARTGIGIKNNKVYIFIATKKSPLTLSELSIITQIWGMEKSMAFDGGGSTSIDTNELHIISDYKDQGRKLKSFLILK